MSRAIELLIVGFTFSVLENPEIDGTGAGYVALGRWSTLIGSYGWSGYLDIQYSFFCFWIDPKNKIYVKSISIFMSIMILQLLLILQFLYNYLHYPKFFVQHNFHPYLAMD